MRTALCCLFLLSGLAWPGMLPAQTLYLPHLTQGQPEWTDYLLVDNAGASDADFILTLYAGGVPAHAQTYTVPARNHLRLALKTLAQDATCGEVLPGSNLLLARVAYVHQAGGRAQFHLSSTAENRAALTFPRPDELPGLARKGLAIMNTTDRSLTYLLTFQSKSDTTTSAFRTLGPKERALVPLDQSLINDGDWDVLEIEGVRIQAVSPQDGRFTAIGVSENADGSTLLFTPQDERVSY